MTTNDNEIETNDKRIKELVKKQEDGTITLIEEDELKKLALANKLLKEEEYEAEKAKQEAALKLNTQNRETFNQEYGTDFDTALQAKSTEPFLYGATEYEADSLTNKDLLTTIESMNAYINDAINFGDEELANSLKENQDELVEALKTRSSSILSGFHDYQKELSVVMNDDGTFDDPNDQAMWDWIESWKKKIYELTGDSGAWNTIQIETMVDSETIKTTQDELVKRLNEGTLTEEDLSNYDGLNDALQNANLILQEGESPASVYLQYLRSISTSQGEVNKTKPDFSFNDSNSEVIDNYQSQLNNLNEALNGLQSGSFSNNDLVDLLQTFPELANKTGDLSSSIQELIDDKFVRLRSILAEEGASPQILKMFSDMAKEVKNFSLDNILSQITDSRNLLKEAQDELKQTKTITVETLQSIATAYPKLNNLINDYMLGKKNEKDIIEALQKEYKIDLDNYKTYILTKKANDTSFYKEIVNGLSEDLINKAKQYGVELKNYKDYNEAKLAIDKQYRLKKFELESEMNDFKDLYANFKPGTSETIFGLKNQKQNFTDDFEEVRNPKNFLEEFDAAIKLEIPDFDVDFQSEFEDSEESIDWAANSIENLTHKINGLNDALENEHVYKKQLELTNDLIDAQKDLLGLRERAKDEYSDRYTKSLNKLSAPELEKYKPLIESDTALSLEMFKGENQKELFDKVSAAQTAWKAYQQALLDYQNQVGVVADTQTSKYELKQGKIQGRIDRKENKKNDIQNQIDIQEAEHGYADESLYQEKIDQNDKLIIDYNDKLEKAYTRRQKMEDKYGKSSQKYLDADKEVQDLENSVAGLTQEQIELNRALLQYPTHKLEETKKLLEEQLKDAQEYKEKISDAISGASELVQGQIDYYTKLKETTEESYDTQIKNIQDQKDALTETNDELKQQLALEEARYNLDRAMNQKTVRVIRNKEFVYEADAGAIRDAQKALDDEQYNTAVAFFDKQITDLEDEKEEALKGIDKQIKSLTTYKEQIDNIIDGYEQVLKLQSLISMFGEDSVQRVLSGDTSIVQEMGTDYVDAASTEKTLQEQIDLYADEIEAIEKYALAWTGSKDTIKDVKKQIEDIVKDTEIESNAIATRNDAAKSIATEWNTTQLGIATELGLIETGQMDAKDNEELILQKRLETLKAFAIEATGYLNEITTALGAAEKLKTGFNNKEPLRVGAGAILITNPQDSLEFHDGMKSGYVGDQKTKDTFKHITLTKLKPDEVPAVLQVGESVLTKLQQTNIMDNMRAAFIAGAKLPNVQNTQTANHSSMPSVTLNGDIVVQNVKDGVDLAYKIKSEFLTKLSQELYK